VKKNSTEIKYDILLSELTTLTASLSRVCRLVSELNTIEPLLTVEEVAAFFQCSEQHVYNIVYSGTLKARKIKGLLRFRKEDVLNAGTDGRGHPLAVEESDAAHA
jgi:excisionase family DNA binding protein